jgi:hypothetical protein
MMFVKTVSKRADLEGGPVSEWNGRKRRGRNGTHSVFWWLGVPVPPFFFFRRDTLSPGTMKALLVTLAIAGVLTAQAGYTGTWWRNDDKSDDPEPELQAAVAGFIQKMSRGRASVEDADPRFVKRLTGVIDNFVQYADELYVERTNRELVVDDGGERLRIYYLDGDEHERQMPDGTRLETTATIGGGRIEVEMETEDGAKIFESYQLAAGGDELVLTVRLEDKQLQNPLVIRSVYTRAE